MLLLKVKLVIKKAAQVRRSRVPTVTLGIVGLWVVLFVVVDLVTSDSFKLFISKADKKNFWFKGEAGFGFSFFDDVFN